MITSIISAPGSRIGSAMGWNGVAVSGSMGQPVTAWWGTSDVPDEDVYSQRAISLNQSGIVHGNP